MLPRKLTLFLLICFAVAFTCSAAAQYATVRVNITPNQSYVFADGSGFGHGSRTLGLDPGHHVIGVYSYGYKPMIHEVDLVAGKNPEMNFTLEPSGDAVPGPFGAIQIEGAPHVAVLLNGKKPEYFVGYGDLFNNHTGGQQLLLVPPGTHILTLVYGKNEMYSTKLEVGANKRVIVSPIYPQNPKIEVKDWPEGPTAPQPRFTMGTASSTIAVAPVTAQFAVDPKQINCSIPAKLGWKTTETLHSSITSDAGNYDELALMGEQIVSPHKTTTYHFLTSGPGGIIETADTLTVDPTIPASLTATPEVRYIRTGDKVLHQDPVVLTWETRYADNINLEPLGKVKDQGSEKVMQAPEKTTSGPVDENKVYQLVATNVCGGAETKQATAHLVGLIEPMISSVFFPTSYPDQAHPRQGLLASQQTELERVGRVFKEYLLAEPNAKLKLTGLADERGGAPSNYALAKRRVNIVKDFLVAKGVPADAIVAEVKGETAPLDMGVVSQLEAKNPQQPMAGPGADYKTKWLAYNRRVDVAIEPFALDSARFYPNSASDVQLLLSPGRVMESKIFDASKPGTVVAAK